VIAPDEFRRVLGHFATGVTVVTTVDANRRPTGLTVSAFASLSLDPPLVLVCVDHKSQSYPALMEHGRFAVNVLGLGHEPISRRFATTTADKFDGVAYAVSPLGLPLIEGALAHIECTTVSTHVEGDHTILVGRVERTGLGDGEPLLYFRGKYGRLQPGAAPPPLAGAAHPPGASPRSGGSG
jgi:flavin reductase (DIM6/NTAB) family NADH-FMN oxidoreductase RutF